MVTFSNQALFSRCRLNYWRNKIHVKNSQGLGGGVWTVDIYKVDRKSKNWTYVGISRSISQQVHHLVAIRSQVLEEKPIRAWSMPIQK